ncbi:MAG TPA: 4'-phosphopantetheinyl transferase superfamily protein [Bryobacteraceae bacterium]|nr:4'-phosphopantetheinyl transferase superfamily protein [Bryobacteraceae bacterium]
MPGGPESAEPNIIRSCRNTIDLWFCANEKIVDPPLLKRYYRQLAPDEREQHGRFCFERHRHQYLITRAMVRNVLSLYADSVSPEEWRFSRNEYGKPWVSGPITRPVRFNVAHTRGMIVLGVTGSHEIGVDVESQGRGHASLEIADRFFSPAEAQSLRSLPIDHQASRFCDLWTLKEAYIKARGMGLSLPLDGFGFEFLSGDGLAISFGEAISDDPRQWRFRLLRASEEHKVAVGIKGDSADGQFDIAIREIIPAERHKLVNWPLLRCTSI